MLYKKKSSTLLYEKLHLIYLKNLIKKKCDTRITGILF